MVKKKEDKFLSPLSKFEQDLLEAIEVSKQVDIESYEDSKGYAVAKKQRADINRTIKAVKDARMKLTKPLDNAKSEAIDLEKKLVGMIQPEKERIDGRIKWYEAEKARIKKEKEEAKRKRTQERIDRLQSVGGNIDLLLIEELDDVEFELLYDRAKKDYEAREAYRQKMEEQAIDKGGFSPKPQESPVFVDSKEEVIPSSMIKPKYIDREALIQIAKTIQGYKPKADLKTEDGQELLAWLIAELSGLGKQLEEKANLL